MANHRLSWYRWTWPDGVDPEYWTACCVSVWAPSYDRPYITVLISVANGGGKCLMRATSLAEARRRVVIPPGRGLDNLLRGEKRARAWLEEMARARGVSL